MDAGRITRGLFAAVLAIGSALAVTGDQATAEEKAVQQKPVIAKICSNCHQAQAGSLRGSFDGISPKAIQIKIDEATEVVKYDPSTITLVNMPQGSGFRDIKKGKEIRIEYTEKDGVRTATLLSLKPPIKVAPEKQLSTTEVEKLVAMGPEKGKYLLIDARPPVRFQQGSIPTAINMPFAAFDKMKDKLPKEKDALIVYFCQGVT